MLAPRRGSDSITFHAHCFTTLPASSCRLATGETPAGSVPSTSTASPAPALFSSFKFNPDAPVFVPRSKEKENQEKEKLEKGGEKIGNSELDRSKAEPEFGAEAEPEKGAESEAEFKPKELESEPELLIVAQVQAAKQEGAEAETELSENEGAEAEPKQERAEAEAETNEQDQEVENRPATKDDPLVDVDGNEVGSSLYPEQENQGTLVVFNLKPDLDIKAAFAAYGDIREIRESPFNRTHKFVEYNDVRDAARALAELNNTEIQGCRVKIEFSKPGTGASQRRCHWNMQPNPLEFPGVDRLWAGSPVTCVPNLCYYDYWGNVYAPFVGQAFTSQYAVEGPGEDQDSEDTRTTLMIRNIPNKYNQEKLIEIIDKYCREQNEGVTEPNQITAYDSIYVPIDHTNKCNKGYAFVNFCSVEARKKFQIAFEGYQWEECSRKTCHINFAKMQIRPGEISPKMTTFQPPRDGRTAQQ